MTFKILKVCWTRQTTIRRHDQASLKMGWGASAIWAGSGWTLVFAEIIDIDEKVVRMMKKRKCQIGGVLLQGVPTISR